MEEKRGNILLLCILILLMIIAIVIVIINPNKIEKTVETHNEIEESVIENQNEVNINKINEQEERKISMQEGSKFCKIGNQIVFYEDTNKTIYLHNLDENKTNKIITLQDELNKMYFDGENIYYLPYYYNAKGIYKIDLQGNIKNIYEGPSLQMIITDNEIYFVKQIGYDDFNQNPQGTICVMDKDGNNVTEIVQNIKNYFFLQNDKIYYTTQDRKMNVINKDGSNIKNLIQGRKFAIEVKENYMIYIDYSNQEAKHILNFQTNEDNVIANFGILKNYQGKTYINARKRLDDGSIENEFTLFEIKENGEVKDLGKIVNEGNDIKYIANGKVYIYSQQEGLYTINLENSQKENNLNYNDCEYFLGGYGYKIDSSNIEDIKVERLEL